MRKDIASLRLELKDQRRLLGQLARAVYTHTRTDLAPDAALPKMRRLVLAISKKRRK